MNIFHYTSGMSLTKILASGVIYTELCSPTARRIGGLTNYVWATESGQFPNTAMGCYVAPDGSWERGMTLQEMIDFTGGIYRIGFNSDDNLFKSIRSANTRLWKNKKMPHLCWELYHQAAVEAGDNPSEWWYSERALFLGEATGIEKYINNAWVANPN